MGEKQSNSLMLCFGVFLLVIGLSLPLTGVAIPAPEFESLALTDATLVIDAPSVVNIGDPISITGYLLYPDGSTDSTRLMYVRVSCNGVQKSDSRYPMQGGQFEPVWFPNTYAVKAYYVPGIINWSTESETIYFEAVGTPTSSTVTVTCSYHGEQRDYPVSVVVAGAFGSPDATLYEDKTPPFTFTYTVPRVVHCYVYHDIAGSGTYVGEVTIDNAVLSDGSIIDIPLVNYLENGDLSPEDGGSQIVITPTPTAEPVNTKTVTIDISGSGTTSPAEGVHVYPVGTTINLVATPSEGYTFDYWLFENGIKRYSASTTIYDLSTDKTALAVFSETPQPTAQPTSQPTSVPTAVPTIQPTPIPTPAPTAAPTVTPTPTYPPELPPKEEVEIPPVEPDYDVPLSPTMLNYVTIIGALVTFLGVVQYKRPFL